MTSKSASILPPIVALLMLVAAWEGIVDIGWVQSFLLPSPSAIAKALFIDRAEFWTALRSTAWCTLCGFAASSLIGLLAAVAFSTSKLLHRALYPYAVFFQTVPIIAIAPLLVIWFGYGAPAVIVSSFIVAFFPMVANTLVGLRSTDPALVDLFRLYRASKGQMLLKLRLPFALPYILGGLKVVAGLAVIGTVVGEFVGGVGLGSVIDIARAQQRVDKVFAAVGLSALLGVFSVSAIDLASKTLLGRWHPSQRPS